MIGWVLLFWPLGALICERRTVVVLVVLLANRRRPTAG